MSKSKAPTSKKRPQGQSSGDRGRRRKPDDRRAASQSGTGGHLPSGAAVRETVESIVIAFVLAFLFRTFEAEAFVIPTGSMAPTLMGRHKEVVCEKCGHEYQVSTSDEVNNENGRPSGVAVVRSTCPMCGWTSSLQPETPEGGGRPSLKGDRILVGKFNYELFEPERWDVAVFKYPGEAQTNYIKRLIGRPGETIRITQGDIFVRDDRQQEQGFEIQQKPPRKLVAMLQPVYDNDLTPRIMKWGWPSHWQPDPAAGSTAGAWQPQDDHRAFETDGGAAGEVWVRYHHWMPSPRQWDSLVEHGALPADDPLREELISDFNAYNSGQSIGETLSGQGRREIGLHWVGDLAVECTLDVQSDQGEAIVELVEGGRQFQCRFDVATGQATLSISGPDMTDFRPTATTAVRGRGRHDIRLSNCDDQLLLWVDGRRVEFDRPTVYPRLDNWRPSRRDLAPVGIGSREAALRVSGLKVLRDIYYIAMRGRRNPTSTFQERGFALDEPSSWPRIRKPDRVEFTLEEDQFLALGDNSAKSKDSRLWAQGDPPRGEPPLGHFVRRELLTGKAIFIYWPDTDYKAPVGSYAVPYFPNFGEMGFVR